MHVKNQRFNDVFTSRGIFDLYVIFLIIFRKSYGNSTHIDLQLVLFIQLYIKLKTTLHVLTFERCMFTKSYIEAGNEAGLQPPQLEADGGDQLLHRRAEVPRAGGEAASPQLREGLAHGHLQGGGQH